MYDLLLDAFGVAVEFLRRAHSVRKVLIVASSVVLFLSITLFLTAGLLLSPDIIGPVREAATGVGIFSGLLTVVSLLSYSTIKIRGSGQITLELDDLRQERAELRKDLAEKPVPDVLNTIRLSLNQLNEYYVINKSQARNSFRFSVFAVVAGLITLISGIWYFYLRSQPNVELTIISSAAGVLTTFIGGAYFYLYRKSLEQLNFFFGQLVRMQDTMLSIRLCEDIVDQVKKETIREKIILDLLARSAPTIHVAKLSARVEPSRGA